MSRYSTFLFVVLFLVSAAVCAADGFTGPRQKDGFTGPSSTFNEVQVKDLEELRDDTRVSLTGTITEQVGDDEFMFTDGTGTVVIDVEDEAWYGVTVSPEDTVTIYGKLDKGFRKLEIEVRRIDKR